MGEELELLETVAVKYLAGIPRALQQLAAVAERKAQEEEEVVAIIFVIIVIIFSLCHT